MLDFLLDVLTLRYTAFCIQYIIFYTLRILFLILYEVFWPD
ncbi:hypothetical protein CLOHYLEM_07066 [[Clostridium] hylemonae DSM 15053]|uniref:Uncharacterized protein n=1 Tax=[Clostridium] hylemonae DSM 15053 TaxID=553973 RepID=C0C4P9_9FIRM|nr:hypothetical protein CLOHYLEM_07066 [[Clostridium] hylemonae DSM 15053]